MNNEERLWENRFKGLNEQYTSLREEYSRIKEEYIGQFHIIDNLEKENKDLKEKLAVYEKENKDMKQKLEEFLQILDRYQKQEIRRSSNDSLNEFAKGLCARWPLVVNTLSLFLPHNGLHDRCQSDQISTEGPCETVNSGKTPQANPDQSLDYENIDSKMFESFFLLGIPNSGIGKAGSAPEILFEFNSENTLSTNKKVLPDFCFPSEIQCRPIRYSASEEEINNILFGPELDLRGSNCYIFTLRSQEICDGLIEIPELPNSDRELIYCICVQVEDIGIDSSTDCEWINPKCLCLLSYIPCFDIHFKFLRALLQLKKIWRMETLNDCEPIRVSLRKIPEEIPNKWESLLFQYSLKSISPGAGFLIEDKQIPSIEHDFNEDLSMIDIPWLLSSLLSSIQPSDFLWLVAAIVQEKSVVFVSYNFDLLTTCVIALHALLRPFKWPYLFVPLIPDSLRELLEAPIPVLAGLPGTAPELRKIMTNFIWVFLDEPNLNKRVQYSNSIYQEVQELPNSLIKQEIISVYHQENQEKKIAGLIRKIWEKIIEKFKGVSCNDFDALNKCIAKCFTLQERPFLQSLIQTQLFINSIDENIDLS